MQLKYIYIVFCFLSLNVFGQKKKVINGDVINIENNKHFAVLMQDTTLSGNRFDSRFDSGIKNDGSAKFVNTMLPPFIIDSTLAVKCEEILQINDTDRVSFYDYTKDNYMNKLSNYIHLFMGYIDERCQLKVVVQFVTPKEFKRNKEIYDKELFLLALQKKLRFAIINMNYRVQRQR